MIHVVLDTNILHQEGLFSRNMQLLGRLAIGGKVTIYIPDLVKREYLSRRVSEATSKLQSIHANLNDVLKKTDRTNPIYMELIGAQTTLSAIAKKVSETIDNDFDGWQTSNNVKLLHFDPNRVGAIFDDYFGGAGVFRQPKSREDLPDAFINLCVQTLLGETKALDVVIKDGAFRQHLQKVDGISVFDGLDNYLQSPKLVDCIAALDAQSTRTDALKQLFASATFQLHLNTYLRAADDQIADIYVEEDNVFDKEKLKMESAFGVKIYFPEAHTISVIKYGSVTQIDDGHFSIEVTFIADATVDYCADYHEFINAPQERQDQIDMDSMNGDGVCDLSEDREVTFSGHVELRFERDHTAETLAPHAEYLDSQRSKIKVELEIEEAAIL